MKKRIEAIVVVEGKSDTTRLQQYYDVDTFETSGMGLNEEMLNTLEHLAKKRDIIIFTDPDMPGEYIRRKVVERIPHCKHVMINKKDAKSKNQQKIGVEHADKAALDEAFFMMHHDLRETVVTTFTTQDMIDYGFIGTPDAKKKRDFVANKLHLGTINAKQFCKRLNLFNISQIELTKLIVEYEEELQI